MNFKNAKLLNGEIYALMLKAGENELRAHIDDVNNLNVFPVPDGDTGDNMWRTVNGGVNALEACKTEGLQDAVLTSSKGMLLEARGNSGVIISQFFKGITDVLKNTETANSAQLIQALQSGVKEAYSSVMVPTEGTILTVARESVEYAASKTDENSTLSELMDALRDGMKVSLEHTPELLPVLKQAGVIDSGGAGLYYVISGFCKVFNEDIDMLKLRLASSAPTAQADSHKSAAESVNIDKFTADDVMEYGFCTELLVRLQNSKTDIATFNDDKIRKFLAHIGDSVVYFRSESLVKLHVHTLEPEKVMEFMHQYGEFLKLKIENMTLEHSSNEEPVYDLPEPTIQGEVKIYGNAHHADAGIFHASNDDSHSNSEQAVSNPAVKFVGMQSFGPKRLGCVCVSTGEGFNEVFTSMGADALIEGGQSHNPSTQDFLDAYSLVKADNILVFPNNKNITMAARQAADLFTGASVFVIDTANLGQGYAAMGAIDPETDDIEDMLDNISSYLDSVSYGSVSIAVRDAEFDSVKVKAGDYIAFKGKKILDAKPDPVSAGIALSEYLLSSGDKSVLTCFAGCDVNEEQIQALNDAIVAAHPEIEAYFTPGGQEVYNFIIVAE